MNIRITSRKFKAKESLKEHIREQVKSLEKYNENILDCNVVLSFTHVKDSIKTAELIVKIPGNTITVSESSEEFEKAINSAVEKAIKQLVKVKSKRLIRKKKNED